MEELALMYYRQGYNCAQCILKAAEERYNINTSNQCVNSCNAIGGGFGIGGMCGVLIAAIMVFGIMFDMEKAMQLRLRLLTEFNQKYKSINCSAISPKVPCCENVIKDVCIIMEKLISE